MERDQPGFVVIDGQPARPLTGALAADGSTAQPGPRGRIWIMTFPENGRATATLTDFTGRRVSSTLRIRGSGWFSSDGAGGLLFSGVGGTYRATPGGLRRLTSGGVIATGPRHYLTIECDARHVCGSYLYGRESSEKRRVASVYTNDVGNGHLSRDGRYAAWVRWGDSGSTLRVTDLRTNRTLGSFPLGGESPTEEGLMVWLPDGRLLGVSEGRLFVFDPRRSRTVRPNLRLPPLIQVALRPD